MNDSALPGFLDQLERRETIVGVIGLGYVGLPLVRAFVAAGLRTMGFDVDPLKVERLRRGESYIGHIPSAEIRQMLDGGRFEPTADMQRLGEADALLICVPTPLDRRRDPDLQYVEQTARQIAATLRRGQLIVLESTTYPGTTRALLAPILAAEQPQSDALQAGRDYFVAYSPEREDPGNPQFSAATIPKLVGGLDEASGDAAAALYARAVVQVVRVGSPETAEASKIVENIYRAVNIAMVNELKLLFERLDVDIWEVIEAAKTKPFGYQPFYPGPGLGGHCIPIDPFYLSWLARQHGLQARFIELAGEINTSMPQHVVTRVAEALNEQGKPVRDSRIGVLGVAYKKNIDDPRESPSFELLALLHRQGAVLSYSDPHVPTLPTVRHADFDLPLTSEPLTPEYLAHLDCVLIATDHDAFDYELIVRHAPLIVDTRNATAHVTAGREKIRRA